MMVKLSVINCGGSPWLCLGITEEMEGAVARMDKSCHHGRVAEWELGDQGKNPVTMWKGQSQEN
jgi:hypothetical protein